MNDTSSPAEEEFQGARCFVCGPSNAVGLHLKFRLDVDVCRAEFTPGPNHVGWDNVTHGGILYSVLDDVMANWLHLQQLPAFTARCEIRYREPLPTGVSVNLEGRCVTHRKRVYDMAGEAIRTDTGSVVAQTTGRFMLQDFRL